LRDSVSLANDSPATTIYRQGVERVERSGDEDKGGSGSKRIKPLGGERLLGGGRQKTLFRGEWFSFGRRGRRGGGLVSENARD
jgi:hypothetical protein